MRDQVRLEGRHSRLGAAIRRGALVLAAAWSLVFALVLGAPSQASAAGLAPWTGRVDLYRPGVFTTQATWTWCTAASVQIARNIALGQRDHSIASQRQYFDFMRAHNEYSIPPVDGVDPQGWVSGLDRFVDPSYRLVASGTFDEALRSAVVSLRRSNLPVGLIVQHGNHAWLLVGFSATADPALSASFRVTGVQIVGPLYGRQSRNGYDPPPDTSLTPAALKSFFTPFADNYWRMKWDGFYVSMQPSAMTASPTTSSAGPAAAPSATTRTAASKTSAQPTPQAAAPAGAYSQSGEKPASGPSANPPAGGGASTPAGASRAGGPASSRATFRAPAAPAFDSTLGRMLPTLVSLVLLASGATGAIGLLVWLASSTA